jgi:radical SAM protein with 4Fe4S-binding SPASM domain
MNSKTFCIIPWAHTKFDPKGVMSPCCKIDINWQGNKKISDINEFDQYWNSDQMKQLRLDQLQGKQVKQCQQCWQDEACGKNSLRQEYNQQFAKHLDLKKIKKSPQGHNDNFPILLDLNLSNICNYACVMCSPKLSSKISQEQKKYRNDFQKLGFIKIENEPANYDWPDQTFFQNLIEKILPNIRSVELKGGEPLLIKNVKKTIANINNKSECTIALTTNGSVDFEDDFLETLSKFKKIWIFVSVDGIGATGEWVRHGSDWNQVDSVIQKVSQLENCVFRLSTVLQVFSPVTFPDIFYYAKQHHYDIEIVQCIYPKHLGINAIPEDIARNFHSWVQDQIKLYPLDQTLKAIDGYLNYYCFDPDLFKNCQAYVSTLDQIRNNQCPDIQALFQ